MVVFLDGSIATRCAASYVRWELSGGGYSSSLTMAKYKIAPKHIVSVSPMELCGAVLSNHLKNYLTKEKNLMFSKFIILLIVPHTLDMYTRKAQYLVHIKLCIFQKFKLQTISR